MKMTKRRPSNKKPTGANKYLGNSLVNDMQKAKRNFVEKIRSKDNYTMNSQENTKVVDSVTDETSLEEFLMTAELAGTKFTAEKDRVELFDNFGPSSAVTNPKMTVAEMYKKCGDKLRIPRRPMKEYWGSPNELAKAENESFLEWRRGLAVLQEVDGVVLTPFERNLELWRQLWRVIERSDLIVQILDARNPLLFRNLDLELYVKECDSFKETICLVNKIDLLQTQQLHMWRRYFIENRIDAVFWSALGPSNASNVSESETLPESSKVTEHDKTFVVDSEESKINRILTPLESDGPTDCPVIYSASELISYLKSRKKSSTEEHGKCRPYVVGLVGYPNVGKSATINRIFGHKKVSVSKTPGKTKHFQTLIIDSELALCDCPGLVMPSFALSRSEMILNGILSIDHMRDCLSPISLLLTRIPVHIFEDAYSVMLHVETRDESLNARDLLTAVAFIRGFMADSGIADCSRAARLILKDVISGRLKWIAAPPGACQSEFDRLTYEARDVTDARITRRCNVMQQLEKRSLIEFRDKDKILDEHFFLGPRNKAHIRSVGIGKGILPEMNVSSKNHFNKGKKEKLRRLYKE